MAKKATWSDGTLDPQKILLDIKNPRIEVTDKTTQDQIRLKLLDLEEVLDLARNIEKNNGLFYGERIITVLEGGKQIVLEGNRRVAACQMLLNPTLIPASYKSRFPMASVVTKAQIQKISADVSPNRASAEPILTKRHTEQGAKPWSPVAKMRRAVRLLDQLSEDEVAQLLGTSTAQVRKLIRPYRLLQYAFKLNIWTDDERKILEDEKLKTNPYTRFFTLSKTQEILQIHFDADQNIVSALPAAKFKEQMARIARDFLIPDPANRGRPRCDTRTDPIVYFNEFLNSATGKTATTSADNKKPSATPAGAKSAGASNTPGATKPKTPKASIFFENLACHIQDNNLIKLSEEIRAISHTRMPIAASLLTRAIFECALVYKIKKEKRWGDLIKADGKDPGLAEIIKFCGNFKNGIFAENNICKTLQSATTTQAKYYLDAMTHLKYQEADAKTLESVANNLRQVIQYILAGN